MRSGLESPPSWIHATAGMPWPYEPVPTGSGVQVREGCRLGHRVIVQNGAVIGADGFGFARDDDGRYLKFPQVGVVVVEVVFVYPGLGQLLVDSVAKRDIPVVQASGLIFALTYVTMNLLADVLSILSNPKLRNPR